MKKARKVASLSIKSPGKMTKVERKDVAEWLRDQAAKLLRHGSRYTDGRYTGGFNYY